MRVNTTGEMSNAASGENRQGRSRMSPEQRHGLVKTTVLDDVERTDLEALAEVCNRHEGLDLPVVLGEPAAQSLCYQAGVLCRPFSAVGAHPAGITTGQRIQ